MAEQNLIAYYADMIQTHRHWLTQFDGFRQKKWEQMLRVDEEAAISEAAVRAMLEANGNIVEPNEDPSTGGPDYKCRQQGHEFFVEATCMKYDKVSGNAQWETEVTDQSEATPLVPLTDSIWSECRSKTRQCSVVVGPCLLAVVTIHPVARVLFLPTFVQQILMGKPSMSWNLDIRTGETSDVCMTTKLESSAFILGKTQGYEVPYIQAVRTPISGILLVSPSSSTEIRTIGALHPKPKNQFNRLLLPQVHFCQLSSGYESGSLHVEWV